jgi:hypothetical protein
MYADQAVRDQLLDLLRGGNAHISLEQAVEDFPPESMNASPPRVDYTCWHLLEHIRVAQWDILEFIRNPDHASPPWPEGYWPAPDERADPKRWEATLDALREDNLELQKLVAAPDTDLYTDLPHAPGYNILREILVVADHNAYHIGEFAILRQVMGTW